MDNIKLYHVSEEPGIKVFHPRPVSQQYEKIKDNAVFAINENMLHNYLLPRDCPRVTFYAKPDSSQNDIDKFLGTSKYVVAVEESWIEKIKQTTLYLYEFPADSFILLDEGAGYYVSSESVKPVSVTAINNLLQIIAERGAELRRVASVRSFAGEIIKSSLQYSIIRLRNSNII